MHTLNDIQKIIDRYGLGKIASFTEHLEQIIVKTNQGNFKIICKDPKLEFPYKNYDGIISGPSKLLQTKPPYPSDHVHIFDKHYYVYKVSGDACFTPSEEILSKAAKVILDSGLFLLNTDIGNRTDQQSLFLTIAGYKPVSLIGSGDKTKTKTGWRLLPTDKEKLISIFEMFDLHYTITSNEHTTDAYVSKDPNLLNLIQDKDHLISGLLYGYPKSAAESLATNNSMNIEDQELLTDKEGIFYSIFRLSKNNFKKEIELLHIWNDLLSKYNLV